MEKHQYAILYIIIDKFGGLEKDETDRRFDIGISVLNARDVNTSRKE